MNDFENFPCCKKNEIYTSFFRLSLFSALFPNLSALTILTATASCVFRLTAKRTLNKTKDKAKTLELIFS